MVKWAVRWINVTAIGVGMLIAGGIATAQTAQTITFAALTGKTFGTAPFTVSATASSGLVVTFSSLTTPVCTVSGATVTLVGAGSCSIRASQAGNATFAAAPNIDRAFTVAKAAQTITFATLAGKTFGNPPFTVSATSTSGLAVAFTSTTTSTCTVAASTVTIVAAGSCTIRAAQPGDTNYLAATNVDRPFTIAKAAQTITFAVLASARLDQSPIGLSATSTSGLVVAFTSATTSICTVSGTTLTLKAAGTCTVNANQAGNASYEAATQVARSFTVTKGNQTITFGVLPSKVYKDPPFPLTAAASSGLAVSFSSLTTSVCTVSGANVTLVAAGACTIRGSQAGNSNWNAATAIDQSLIVSKATQTISFAQLANRPIGSAPFVAAASSTSNLAVSFMSTTTGVCSISSTTVTLLNTGTCTIQANQAGNANYLAAPVVSRSFLVTPPPAGASFAGQVAYPMALQSTAVIVGDFNNDGNMDFASINESNGNVNVRLGNGNATFGTLISSAGLLSPSGIAAGDFNKDGLLDLAIADTQNNQVSIAYGNGDGTFYFSTVDFEAVHPRGIAVGDLNADGFLDLVVTNQSIDADIGQTVAVYLAMDEWGFNLPTTYAVGMNPTSVAIADLNGDGKPDLAIGNAGSNSVSILLGTGTGAFTPATARTFNSSPQNIAVADMNNDGKVDLVASFFSGVGVSLGNGMGSFAAPTYFSSGNGGSGLVIGDFNADGIPDVAVGNYNQMTISVLVGVGTGSLLAGGTFPANSGPNALGAADFDFDGKLDLIATNYGVTSASFLRNSASGPQLVSLTATAGAGQASPIREKFTLALSATVKDGSGTPLSGVIVTFSAPSGGPSAVFSDGRLTQQVATDSLGIASVTARANSSAGHYVVIARVSTLSASFSLDNTVLAAPAFASGSPPAGAIGQPYLFGVHATGDPAPTFFLASGSLPQGLELHSNGLLTGIPSIPGNYSGTFGATNNPNDAPVTQSFSILITSGSQSIDFPQPTSHPITDPPFAITATATSGLPVAFTSLTPTTCSVAGLTVTILSAAGTCSIRASQAGNQFWLAAPTIDRSFLIGLSQTITFGPIADRGINLSPLPLAGSSTSGLPVTFVSLTPGVCTISGTSATLMAVGHCTIRASQSGNGTYMPAATVDRSFAVTTVPPIQFLYDANGNVVRIQRN